MKTSLSSRESPSSNVDVSRRRFGGQILGGWVAFCTLPWPLAVAHTPYKQWQVYRRKHLLIGCHKQDAQTYSLAKMVVREMESGLPTAKARIARGPTVGRIASLMGTDQMDVAIISKAHAPLMATGTNLFKPYGAIELRSLHQFADHVLVSRADFPAPHAWLVASALSHHKQKEPAQQEAAPPVPWHDGAHQFRMGQSIPK